MKKTVTVNMAFTYEAEIEQDEDGRFLVTFPAFGWGATDGETLEEAMEEGHDLLRELISSTLLITGPTSGGLLPAPKKLKRVPGPATAAAAG